MYIQIDGENYFVKIDKKKTTKNLYIRVKDDLTIYVTCNTFFKDKKIWAVLEENEDSIKKMIKRVKQKKEQENFFYLLGKKYDIIYTDTCDFKLGEEKVFLSHNFDLDKWQKVKALALFQDHLEICYQKFTRNIPHPTLRLRKMKTRWGVCNTKTHVITLNTELLKKEIKCLDYVIVHELSHLVEANHSKRFWKVVEENFPDYQIYRKKLRFVEEE